MSSELERSYKARDLEGFLDVFFYRRAGLALARIFATLQATPATVTFLSCAFGIFAGHLYFYRSLAINVTGMALHIAAIILDNADGQLARLTNKGNRFGRVLDGFCDHLVFVSIYVHLCLRHVVEGGSAAIWILAAAAGLSHALQSATADHCRNGYLYFALGKPGSSLESSEEVRAHYRALPWRGNFWRKLLLRNYLNYTVQQEMLAPGVQKLRALVETRFGGAVPSWISDRYREAALPLARWFSVLTTNTRVLFLFLFLFLGHPDFYFVFELLALNFVLAFVLLRQQAICRDLLVLATDEK